MRRALTTSVVGAVCVLGLTGCTVMSGAVAGIGVNADGVLSGYVKVCTDGAHIDGATLYEPDNETEFGTWSARKPVTDQATWALTGHSQWESDPTLQPLEDGHEYYLYGWSDDNSYSAVDVTFTPADLANLQPGQVLHWAPPADPEQEYGQYVISTVDDFYAHACDDETW